MATKKELLEDIYPLSPLQQGMLFDTLRSPVSGMYVEQVVWSVGSGLDERLLRDAWQMVIERHAVLRTAFAWEGLEEPLQLVYRQVKLPWRLIDLRRPGAALQGAQLQRLLEEDRRKGFDLKRPPLARLTLIRQSGGGAKIVWSLHHLLLDGWSAQLVLREVESIYESLSQSRAPRLDPPPPYRDYISWVRKQDAGEAKQFWAGRLRGLRTPTPLPFDPSAVLARPGEQERSCRLGRAATASLQALARRCRTTLNTVVTAAWAIFLQRCSGEPEVTFGTVVTTRPAELPGSERMVGLLVNTLPFRVRVRPRQKFSAWLRELHGLQVEMGRCDYCSLAEIQGWSDLPRGAALFQSLYGFENLPRRAGDGLKSPGLLRQEALLRVSTGYPLSLIVHPFEGLQLLLRYQRQRFESATIERMLAQLKALLGQMAEDPERRLECISPLTPAQRQQALEWNDTRRHEEGAPAALRIARQATLSPDAVAVASSAACLSYGELAQLSDRMARRLARLGARMESRVGIFMPRSPEWVAAMLGVWKCGAAYLPLDVDQPPQRLHFMLQDSSTAALAALRVEASQRRVWQGIEAVVLERDWGALQQEGPPAPVCGVEPLNLAYVIYTSGSTGRPKGTEITHRGLSNLISWQTGFFGLAPAARVSQLSRSSFDASVWEVWSALAAGAALELIDDRLQYDPRQVLKRLSECRLDFCFLPTPLAELALAEEMPRGFAPQAICTAGDRLHRGALRRLPQAPLYNLYGPTENTVCTSWHRVGEEPGDPPIGWPISNVRIDLLDRSLCPVPLGTPGEMHLSGLGLARGYGRRPARTASSFLPHPFSDSPGERLYKTGDLARRRHDGQLEFLGRLDHQVKLRGCRIELGEIESVLLEHPEILEAAAVLRQSPAHDPRIAAYLVFRGRDGRDAGEEASVCADASVHDLLRRRLPAYMIPAVLVELKQLPLTPSGKVDRRALPEPPRQRPAALQPQAAPRTDAERRIASVWQEALRLDHVGAEENFFDLGGHSLLLLRVQGKLKKLFSRNLAVADLFAYPTVRTLAAYLSGEGETPAQTAAQEAALRTRHRQEAPSVRQPKEAPSGGMGEWPQDSVAVIGMACRFPGAADPEQFWRNLCGGVESVSFFSDEEVRQSGVDPELAAQPGYVKARAVLDGIELFDAEFFGFSPREAALTDPQQRVFLECVWEGLESAGYDSRRFKGRIGLFAGSGPSTYLHNNIQPHRELVREAGGFQLAVRNEKDFLCTQASYRLNLKGPSINVNTACSTSLVAVHLACRSLADHQCEMAAAGGVTIVVPQKSGYLYQQGGIASPDGHCRPFDARAGGTVGGNGAGVVILKRLADALKDKDFIHAVIRGSAVNNDGSLKVGFTAPGRDGQAEVIIEALEAAEAEAHSIGLLEAHGTGTELGDPVEVDALTRAFRRSTDREGFCALGSVKSNLGHLDAAAGVAGLIKAVLALRHRMLPPSLHFESPNPRIGLAETPFRVNGRLSAWESGPSAPRRAGVSSFGIGGTNAHVIVQQAPPAPSLPQHREHHLIVLSARSPAALRRLSLDLSACLQARPEIGLARTAYTLQAGRRRFSCRRFLICSGRQEAVESLAGKGGKKPEEAQAVEEGGPAVAFLFPGQGIRLEGMAGALYRSEKVFRDQVDRCAELLKPHLGRDLREMLCPTAEGSGEASRLLEQTRFAQPALFTLEYALAFLWSSWGIRPQAMIGHSLGEYAAACLAGVFSLPDALEVVALRGDLMQQLPKGSMLAVPLGEEQIRPLLTEGLALAAVNGPDRSVVSGPEGEVEALQRRLRAQGTACRMLPARRAFHSPMVTPILREFESRLRRFRLNSPRLPFLSNLSGDWIRQEEAADPEYWARHMRQTVLFGAGIARLMSGGRFILLEAGPGRSLTSAALRHPEKPPGQLAFPSLTGDEGDIGAQAQLLRALGRLWLAGVEVDWEGFHQRRPPGRVPLPFTPFERQRHWVDPPRLRGLDRPAPSDAAFQADRPADRASGGQSAAHAASTPPAAIRSEIREFFARLLGLKPEAVEDGIPFAELGVDSLLLLQASHHIQDWYGVEIPFRQMMGEAATVAALSDRLAAAIPSPAPEKGEGGGQDETPRAAAPSDLETLLQTFMNRQVEAMSSLLSGQLEVLRQLLPDSALPAGPALQAGRAAPAPASASAAEEDAGEKSGRPAPYIPYQPIRPGSAELTEGQREHLEALVERLGRRTRQSKRLTEESRPALADSRASAGFRMLWKELLYPIAVRKASGSRVWDVDGNEYVDISMGFGSLLFGHSPPFLVRALQEQIRSGLQIGLQSPLAGKAARIVCRMTGAERAAFLNSGTEAVAAALRLARTATGRTKFVLFKGSYHGFFDEVLVRSAPAPYGSRRSVPMAPGIPSHVSDSVVVFDYCRAESLEQIRRQSGELAAVLVEPQQSRLPGEHDAGKFLRELRRLTLESGTALIFDEVILGFRIHPGGAQAHYGVRADMAVYGKAAGGGLPVGIVAGKKRFLDGIDGGQWNYGDLSYPRAETTFIAGTYFKHPLNMAAIWASLDHLEKNSPALQENLNCMTERLTGQLDSYFRQEGLPVRMMRFGSLFRFAFDPRLRHTDLFYYHLLERGVYVWEGRGFFLSTAHSDEDLQRVVDAVQAGAGALRRGGFLPASPAGRVPSQGRAPAHAPAKGGLKACTPTEAQKELWSLAQMGEEASRAYNEPWAVRLLGPFRLDAMRAAFGQIAQRHEALRASFNPRGSLLKIATRGRAEVPLIDLSGLDAEMRSSQREALLQREAHRAFDLGRRPLFRVRILRLMHQEHWLAAVFHHTVIDGLSNSILLRELAALYSAACRGEDCRLPRPTPFSGFAAWQTRRLQGERLNRAQAFWLGQFSPPPPPLQLPLDRPRPTLQAFDGLLLTRSARRALLQRLKEAAAKSRTSLFTLVLTGFQLLLHRLSGQQDLAVGVVSAGQAAMGAPALVGYCVNLLPIRSSSRGDPPLERFLAETSQRLLDASEHQYYPFSRLVKELGLRPDPSRPPLVSALINMERRATEELEFLGLQAQAAAAAGTASKFDVELEARLFSDRLELALTCSRRLFEKTTAQRWLGHLLLLLEGVCRPDARQISQFGWLSPAELHQLMAEWRGSSGRAPLPDACLHDAALARARQAPDVAAAVLDDQHLSYGEMSRRAGCLASLLQQKGIRPGEPVGLCMPGSLESLTALLGVSLAGACFAALDPGLPRQRLDFFVKDSQMRLALTPPQLPQDLLPTDRVETLHPQEAFSASPGPGHALGPNAFPEGPAYLIYTSGSTGKPKGVVVSHAAACGHFAAMERLLGLRPGDRVLQFYSLSFDAALDQIFPALAAGCCLILRGDQLWDTARTPAILGRQAVTVADLPTSYWGEMTPCLRDIPRLCPALRQINVGGEEMPFEKLRLWQDGLPPSIRLLNLYGPTEAVATAAGTEVNRADSWSLAGRRAPIGRPLNGRAAYVLDRLGQPAAVGVSGQLHLGGALLACAYLGRPADTAQSFIPDPFSPRPGARLYKTGDLARFRPDGLIEFLSRCDRQVKLRGFRIELGEVEGALRRHPRLKACAVLLREERPGHPRLIAYCVLDHSEATEGTLVSPLPATELRTFLQEQLPGYMVPEAFAQIPRLPLTPGGKVDRQALPALVKAEPSRQGAGTPRSGTEKRLAEIWADLLGIEKAGAADDFFEMGGHSLLLARAVSEVRQAFGISLGLPDFLQAPTPALLAERIEKRLSGRRPAPNASQPASLEEEAVLEGSIRPPAQSKASLQQPGHIFLTGSTGFLGAFLLDRLLKETDAEVYCLVRAEGKAAGEEKILQNLEKYGLDHRRALGRLHPLPGDLGQPLLGMSERQFQNLCGKVGTIFHNGAAVNFILPYPSLKAPNVLGTREVIRLACRSRLKTLHHISTLSVFSAAKGSRRILETDPPDAPQSLLGGYAQSKRVAEELVREARHRGLPAAVYRLGGIGGDSKSGAGNTDDLLVRLIKGCLQMGCAPDLEFRIEATPADFMAQAILHISRQPGSPGGCFHLTNPKPLPWKAALDWMRGFGYPLRLLPYPEWVERLKGHPENALTPVLTLFADWDQAAAGQPRLDFDCARTLESLALLKDPWPPVDYSLLETYFQHWIASGYLRPPGGKGKAEEELVGLKGSAS